MTDDFERRWRALNAAARAAPERQPPRAPDIAGILARARPLRVVEADAWALWERWSLRTLGAVAALVALAAGGVLVDAWATSTASAPPPDFASAALARDGVVAAAKPSPPIPEVPP